MRDLTTSPTPWWAEYDGDAEEWFVLADTTVEERREGRTIAHAFHGSADAQLMAAAPDLLAALERAQRHLSDGEDLDAARTAIRKARGLA